MNELIDKYGRKINYVRLSITDRCDFRCSYCMSENIKFLPKQDVMTLDECFRIARIFVELGIKKLRITGGEPLVRQNVMWLIEQLSRLSRLDSIVLTTNGSKLEQFAKPLRYAGVERINISLDSLISDRFRKITRIGDLGKVMKGIEAVKAAGFNYTKINTVMLRGINDDEFVNLVNFSLKNELDISFIEQMPLGELANRKGTFISSDEARTIISKSFDLLPTLESSGGPAKYWRIPGMKTRIGFISPHSNNFCNSCNRIRITAKGDLYPCLGHNDSISLLSIMRNGGNDEDIRKVIVECMGIKPHSHDFSSQMEVPQVLRYMSMTGG
ncbi:GTP 3',8-cyclase MoaA [Ampullimonas aquatilis]|uniref:GTP 3',8-cyclase MoaA n=1 Tax=Ampullimonas aquatilis TaxID=1341549 RepID=UPI003C77A83C